MKQIALIGVIRCSVTIHIPCVSRFSLNLPALIQDDCFIADADCILQE